MVEHKRLTVTARTEPNDDRTGSVLGGTLQNINTEHRWDVRNSDGQFSASIIVLGSEVEIVRDRLLENLQQVGGFQNPEAMIK